MRKGIVQGSSSISTGSIDKAKLSKPIVIEKGPYIKLSAQTAIKNAKSLSGPVGTVRYIVRNASRSARPAARLSQAQITGPGKRSLFKKGLLINIGEAKTGGPKKRRKFSRGKKDAHNLIIENGIIQ